MNAFPLLLLGGAAVIVMSGKKKRSRQALYEFKYLKIGPGCKSVTLNGEDVIEQLKLIQEDDETVRQTLLENMKLFWLEDMPLLILKVRPNPDVWDGEAKITEDSMNSGIKKLMMASTPSCYVSKEAMKNTVLKALKDAKNKEDIEGRLMPLVVKLFVKVMIAGGYQVNLINEGIMDKSDLSDFEEEMMESLPEDMQWMTGEGEGPTDPNQAAMVRAGFFTEAALQATQR